MQFYHKITRIWKMMVSRLTQAHSDQGSSLKWTSLCFLAAKDWPALVHTVKAKMPRWSRSSQPPGTWRNCKNGLHKRV